MVKKRKKLAGRKKPKRTSQDTGNESEQRVANILQRWKKERRFKGCNLIQVQNSGNKRDLHGIDIRVRILDFEIPIQVKSSVQAARRRKHKYREKGIIVVAAGNTVATSDLEQKLWAAIAQKIAELNVTATA